MSAETAVTKHYEVSKTTEAYSENGEIYVDGQYRGFGYYGWTRWTNPLDAATLRLYELPSIEKLDRETIFKLLLQRINPQDDFTENGGVRIREVITTVVTQNDEDSAGNFVRQDSTRVEAVVVYEDFVTKERAKEKEAVLAEALARRAANDARYAEEQRQAAEEAAKTTREQSFFKRIFGGSR